MLNLDLLEQLNKQSQWQYGKITRSPKVAHQLQSYFSQRIPEFSMEKAKSEQETEISIQGLHSSKGEYTGSQRFRHSKPLDFNYKEDSPKADRKIQARYSKKGVIKIHSGRKRTRCKKICMIRNIANPLLASVLLPDTFCNKNNASSAEATKT